MESIRTIQMGKLCAKLFTRDSVRMVQILDAILEIRNHLYMLDVVHEEPWYRM